MSSAMKYGGQNNKRYLKKKGSSAYIDVKKSKFIKVANFDFT